MLYGERQVAAKEMRSRASDRSLLGLGFELLRHFGHGVEQVRHEPEVGHGENGRLGVLVNAHDHAAVLHARQVLNRARDAHRDVELLLAIISIYSYCINQ